MKPFNLELAKQGHPVVTRDGEPVRILCTDRKHDTYPIIALVTKSRGIECSETFMLDGRYNHLKIDCPSDLFMAPVKKKAWVNIYQGVNQSMSYHFTHFSEDDAYQARYHGTEGNGLGSFIGTVTYEWEE